MGDLKDALEYKLRQDLKFSKSTYIPWGRQVIRAIDFDDCTAMVKVFEERAELGAHVDTQATSENYGGHTWTAWITNFVGDTALHMALRQNKMKCVYMLIAMGACTDIENSRGQTAEDLIIKKGLTVRQLELDAFRVVLPQIPITTFQHLPKRSPHTAANFPSVEREAWELMEQGRNMYVEVPKCFAYDDIIPDPKTFKEQPRKWATRYDAKTKRRYRIDAYSGDVEWLADEPKKKVNPMDEVTLTAPPTSKKQWSMVFDDSGQKYYHNHVTGQTQWEIPDEMKSAKQLELEAKEKWKQERMAQGLPVDSDEEFEYKPKGESDSEDEEEEMLKALKAKRIREEQEKADEAQREEREKREEWARQNQAKRKGQRQHEIETGINVCSGAVASGDVYCKNRVTDTIQLLARQRRRQLKENKAEAHRLSGLTLMDAASCGEKPGLSSQLLRGLRDLKGVQRLKFGRYQELRKLANELEESPDPHSDLSLPYRYITKLSTRTNLKAMAVSDFGLQGMAAELIDDRCITVMCLFSAGVSLRGSEALAKTLPTMRSLTSLDLSANAIDDAAAEALAGGLRVCNEGASYRPFKDDDSDQAAVAARKLRFGSLEGCLPLVKLSLAGNRITFRGARAVVEAVMDDRSTLRLVSLTNNFLRSQERNELARIAGPHHDHTRGQQRYAKRYAFPGPGGRTMKWPFHLYPFKKHPMHPSNNPTPESFKYWVKYCNDGNTSLSGVTRGDNYPERGEWQPLELRQRYADRANAKREREASKPVERAERRSMNDCDAKQYYVSNAEMILAEEAGEGEDNGTCSLPLGNEQQVAERAMVPPQEAVLSQQYSEEEIAQNADLVLELEALKHDDKVTSMSRKGEKVLRQSPRGDEDKGGESTLGPQTPTAGAGQGSEATQGSALRREAKYMNTGADMRVLSSTRQAASGRKIRFADEPPAASASGVSVPGTGFSKLAQIELEVDDAEAELQKREQALFDEEQSRGDEPGDVGDFGQEALQPGERGPPHLRELDILF